ncbi:glutamine amidotransferase [Halomonas vilamensis]|uniref:Glutamine amidotransferase n=1 Tax=Vreelandella vilamensis TaxID=531309 RepID=A0ABU1H5S3_9GAMM|nr:glutamine amidotransferase [Halomonas vilamensis]MDR5899102.1 glutamine amidotransferase [Halomonas vilamensis]
MPCDSAVKHIAIIKTGDAFPDVVAQHGDFEALFAQQIRPALSANMTLRVVDAPRDQTLPELSTLAGIVITGSHSMVSDAEPWSENLKPWLREALSANVPMLGVCYGHQLMAAAFGGVSDYHPAGRESGTYHVYLTPAGTEDALFRQLTSAFPAHLTHAQSVITPPPGATVLANNTHDAYQALRYGPRQWSVQFHPEFTPPVMRAYLAHQRDALAKQGQDSHALQEGVSETPEATRLFTHFIAQL